MIPALLLSLLPYCTPMRSDFQLGGCLNFLYACIYIVEENEENCVENIPIKYWPK